MNAKALIPQKASRAIQIRLGMGMMRGGDFLGYLKELMRILRARAAREWPQIQNALEAYAARDPAEPEEAIRTQFNDIDSATFSARKLGFTAAFAFFVIGGLWAGLVPIS